MYNRREVPLWRKILRFGWFALPFLAFVSFYVYIYRGLLEFGFPTTPSTLEVVALVVFIVGFLLSLFIPQKLMDTKSKHFQEDYYKQMENQLKKHGIE